MIRLPGFIAFFNECYAKEVFNNLSTNSIQPSSDLNRRYTECSETCAEELQRIKQFVDQVVTVDRTPELMALQKSLELFGHQ